MKRFVSILMTLLILLSFAGLSASALDSAETKVSVSKGNEVTYTLYLTVPEKVVGCDMSVYYDSSVLKVKSITDMTGQSDPEKHQAFLNYNLVDEVKCVFSHINGYDYSKSKSLISVTFECTSSKTVDTHISYYVRYLYPISMVQYTDYTFTCDVSVAGKQVIDNAAPELNVDTEQSQGEFINSVNGKGEDANVINVVGKKPIDKNNGSDNTTNTDGEKATTEKPTSSENATQSENETLGTATGDSATADTATPDEKKVVDKDNNFNIFATAWFWIVIGVVVIGVGTGLYLILRKKKNK